MEILPLRQQAPEEMMESLEALSRQQASHERLRMRYGGKALNLARLIAGGFNVPDGFVISSHIFESYAVAGSQKSDGKDTDFHSIEFEPSFREALRGALSQISSPCWAVRSSSSDEDSQAHSFAGLQESVIGVTDFESCLEAIRTVWMSFFSRERLLYPIDASLDGAVPSMGVVIQSYIEAESAGVVFTHHPMKGAEAMLINVSSGQGAVVNGKACESLTVSRTAEEAIELPGTLTATQVRTLTETAARIEAYFGAPQDIEFAFSGDRLYILQSRDIVRQQAEKHVLYSNVNVGEALSGVCSPMTWSVGMSIAEKGFETIFSTFGLSIPKGYTFVTTFNGHIYLNISEILSVLTQVPFIDASGFGKIAGIKDLEAYTDVIERLPRSYFIRQLPRTCRHLFSMQKQLRHLSSRAETFRSRRDALLSLDLTQMNRAQLKSAFERLDALFFDCAYDMLEASAVFLGSYILCSSLLDKFNVTDDESPEAYLFSGLLNVQSAAPGLMLLQMSNDIRRFKPLTEVFLSAQNFDDIASFRAKTSYMEGGESFWRSYDEFMKQYGARAHQEAELANPRWREEPSFLFRVICTHLKSPNSPSPERVADETRAERENHTNAFRDMLSHRMRPFFRSILGWAQKNARLREEWRAYVVDVLGLYRRFYLAAALRLVAEGLLARPEDIFYLTHREFCAWLDDPKALLSARLRVMFRRARHETYLQTLPLPETFLTHPNRCKEPPNDASHHLLRGIPASPGCVRAKVRVARTLEEASALEYGEILVTEMTDVGWTPLFLVASAVLTQKGGSLSHAFVVAREYGVPAVVSIPHLLDVLKTGDVVTVSGQKGLVSLM